MTMLVNHEIRSDLFEIVGHIIQNGHYNKERQEYYYEGMTLHADYKDMDFILYDNDKMIFMYDSLSGIIDIEDTRVIDSLIELINFDYAVMNGVN